MVFLTVSCIPALWTVITQDAMVRCEMYHGCIGVHVLALPDLCFMSVGD